MRKEYEIQKFYEAQADYLREAEPIIAEMDKLRTLFTSRQVVIDCMDMTIHDEWISEDAANLYSNYEKMLEVIRDRHADALDGEQPPQHP